MEDKFTHTMVWHGAEYARALEMTLILHSRYGIPMEIHTDETGWTQLLHRDTTPEALALVQAVVEQWSNF